jgi:hypothetical protein
VGARSGERKSMGELRIMKDLEELDVGSNADVTADPADMLQISVTVKPDEGFWCGGRFGFKVVIPRDYPHSPPKVKCITEVRAPLSHVPSLAPALESVPPRPRAQPAPVHGAPVRSPPPCASAPQLSVYGARLALVSRSSSIRTSTSTATCASTFSGRSGSPCST